MASCLSGTGVSGRRATVPVDGFLANIDKW